MISVVATITAVVLLRLLYSMATTSCANRIHVHIAHALSFSPIFTYHIYIYIHMRVFMCVLICIYACLNVVHMQVFLCSYASALRRTPQRARPLSSQTGHLQQLTPLVWICNSNLSNLHINLSSSPDILAARSRISDTKMHGLQFPERTCDMPL